MNLFRVFDLRNGAQSFIQAFDLNGARRMTKKANGWSNIPKKVLIQPVSQQELNSMFQRYQESQAPVETTDETPLVDPTNGFQVIQEAEKDLITLEGKVEEFVAEAATL